MVGSKLSLGKLFQIRHMITIDVANELCSKLPLEEFASQPFFDANMDLGDHQGTSMKDECRNQTKVDKKDIIGGRVSSSSSSSSMDE
jgi:hypothetical protein